MRDRKLEKQISQVEKFIGKWKKLGDAAFPKEESTRLSDEELLALKEELAEFHGYLMVTLDIDERRGIDFLELMGKSFQGAELRRHADSWHSCLIFMDEVLGRLKGRKKELAAISRGDVAVRAFFSNPFVRLAALVACILLLFHILKAFVLQEEAPRENAGVTIERIL